MAITKLSFTKIKAGIKASLRYYIHAHEEEGKRLTRTLFGRDGKLSKYQAYRIIDKASWNTTFFRMILSPDKMTEDKDHRLNMRDVTQKTMKQLQAIMRSKEPLDYLGVEHRNTDDRHVHAIFFVKGKISKEQLRKIRTVATQASMTEEEWQEQQQRLAGRVTGDTDRYFGRERHHRQFQPTQCKSVRHERQERRFRSFGGSSPKTTPLCPSCMSFMTRAGRWWNCPICGMAVNRKRGRGIEIRQQKKLELSITKEVGEYTRGY